MTKTRSTAAAKFDPRASEAYGELREGVHLAGYTFERACTKLEWLLAADERWRGTGHSFADVNAFLDSVKLDNLKAVAEVRKRVAVHLKQLQPGLSNRRIAKTLGVGETTVRRDTAPNGAPREKNQNKISKHKALTAPNGAPALSGAAAARTVERAGRVKEHQANVSERIAKAAMNASALGKFSLLLADPPWDDEFGACRRSIENHYPTMSFEQILALPVADVAHAQAMLFLWATPSMIEMALQAAERWQFDYRTMMVWVKPSIGLGKYVRQRHELLLICRRGEHPAPAPEHLPDSVTEAPRGAHSAKPEVFHEIIERMYPAASKIELFRRGPPRAGWAAWGAEAEQAAMNQAAE